MDDLVQTTASNALDAAQSGDPWATIVVACIGLIVVVDRGITWWGALRRLRNGTAQGSVHVASVHVAELARQVEASADATTRLVDRVQRMDTCLAVVKDTVQRIDRRTEAQGVGTAE